MCARSVAADPRLLWAGVVTLLAGTGVAPAGQPQGSPEPFYACPAGLAFQTRRDAARCHRPTTLETTEPEPCPTLDGVALAVRVDATGVRDTCAGRSPRTGDLAVARRCAPGFSALAIAGPDRCERRLPEVVVPPNVAVFR